MCLKLAIGSRMRICTCTAGHGTGVDGFRHYWKRLEIAGSPVAAQSIAGMAVGEHVGDLEGPRHAPRMGEVFMINMPYSGAILMATRTCVRETTAQPGPWGRCTEA